MNESAVTPNAAALISSGEGHTCAITAAGRVSCWGLNFDGQLGTSTNNGNLTPLLPTLVPGIDDAVAVGAGDSHTCVIRANRTVWCFGKNDFGQLGTTTNSGTSTPLPIPTQVPGIDDAIAIGAGYAHTCVIRANRTVWCFGWNVYGQRGIAPATPGAAPTPTAVPGIDDASAVAVRGFHTCVLRTTGTVMCFGMNNLGQLGTTKNNGLSAANTTPTAVPGIADAIAVAAGRQHTCVLRATRAVWCFGSNESGELGTTTNNGTVTATPTPAPVSGLDDAVGLTGGTGFTCVRRASGSVWCFGKNDLGQLGRDTNVGTTTPTPTPGAVPGIDDATAVNSGSTHTCVVRATGVITCFGRNNMGQMGTATGVGTNTPSSRLRSPVSRVLVEPGARCRWADRRAPCQASRAGLTRSRSP